jgi:hypothetical protein
VRLYWSFGAHTQAKLTLAAVRVAADVLLVARRDGDKYCRFIDNL